MMRKACAVLILASALSGSASIPMDMIIHGNKLDGKDARKVFHVAMNFDRSQNATVLLSEYIQNVIAQVPPNKSIDSKQTLLEYLNKSMLDEVAALENYTERDVIKDARSRDFQCERIRQNTPMNLVDGMWGNSFIPDAVPKPYVAIVDKIRWEEQGEGDALKNHPYMWTQTYNSVGYSFPPTDSLEFSQHSDFEDKSFWNAALTAAVGRIGVPAWIPETLGMIAFLEMRSSAPCHKTIQHMKRHGLDFSYYQVHRSIDNPHDGHGVQALQAINDYLTNLASKKDQAEHSHRVYLGYHAFEFTIDAIDEAVDAHLPRGGCPQQHASGIVTRATTANEQGDVNSAIAGFIKRHSGAFHFHKKIGKEIFQDPAKMVAYLQQERCDLFEGTSPDESKFVRLFKHGCPMYGVGSWKDHAILKRFAAATWEMCTKANDSSNGVCKP